MTIQLELPSEIEGTLHSEARKQGQDPAQLVLDIVKRQLALIELEALREVKPPQSVADLKPRKAMPPGTTWLEAARGQWPGEETDEQVERALREMS